MTPTQTLKDMILAVDPKDTAAMDEVDHSMSAFLGIFPHVDIPQEISSLKKQIRNQVKNYTRSLDALKAVMDAELEGWEITLEQYGGETFCLLHHCNGDYDNIQGKLLPTMELAWLYAIIESIEWKRNNENQQS